MTTNTNTRRPAASHANCTHPATKQDRARCRRSKAATPHTIAATTKRIATDPRLVIETCSCNVPVTAAICPLCDRPADTMNALGLLLTA